MIWVIRSFCFVLFFHGLVSISLKQQHVNFLWVSFVQSQFWPVELSPGLVHHIFPPTAIVVGPGISTWPQLDKEGQFYPAWNCWEIKALFSLGGYNLLGQPSEQRLPGSKFTLQEAGLKDTEGWCSYNPSLLVQLFMISVLPVFLGYKPIILNVFFCVTLRFFSFATEKAPELIFHLVRQLKLLFFFNNCSVNFVIFMPHVHI